MKEYEYKCVECGKVQALAYHYSDWALKQGYLHCSSSSCTGRVRRLFYAAPAHFKGGGWASKA